jgi:sugar O-acyltransferase (sialic acid O-acetyltransferase NeuD family)
MTKRVIIFGSQQTAQLAEYYLTEDTDYEVDSFTIHNPKAPHTAFSEKPLLPFADIVKLRPPEEYLMFAPMMASGVNRNRLSIFNTGLALGYSFISYVSTKATVLTENIGRNCFILENNTIQPYASIGDNCMVWSGNHIGHHAKINHSCFISSQCVISGNVEIGERSYLGVNCSIVDGSKLEEGVMVGMGAVLTNKKTQAGGFYLGNPAKLHPKLTSDRLLK